MKSNSIAIAVALAMLGSVAASAANPENKSINGVVAETKSGDKVTAVTVTPDKGAPVSIPADAIAKFEKLDKKAVDVECVFKDGKVVSVSSVKEAAIKPSAAKPVAAPASVVPSASKTVVGIVAATKTGDKVTAVTVTPDKGAPLSVPTSAFALFEKLDKQTVEMVCSESKDGKIETVASVKTAPVKKEEVKPTAAPKQEEKKK